MGKYKVVIEEQVTERRTYEVEAPSHFEAAEIASHKWLNLGEDDPEGAEVNVTDRGYTVTDVAGITAVFGVEVEHGEEVADA